MLPFYDSFFFFLQDSIENFKAAQQKSGDASLYQEYINKAQRSLAEAQKDNDFIYHERVPEVKSLEAVGKAPLAKIAPMPERLSNSFKGKHCSCAILVFYNQSKS